MLSWLSGVPQATRACCARTVLIVVAVPITKVRSATTRLAHGASRPTPLRLRIETPCAALVLGLL